MPALNINKEELDRGLGILEKVLHSFAKDERSA
jgi:hypothetical protein